MDEGIIKQGRELDRIIERALGTDIEQLIQETWVSYRRYNAGKGMSGTEPYDPRERDRMLCIAIPLYSWTDEAAMLLVDKMVKAGYRFWMTRFRHFAEAEFVLYENGVETTGWAEAETVPLAICEATLRVKRLIESQEEQEE